MTGFDVLIWAVAGILAFVFALAVQLRVLAAYALRKALIAWNAELDPAQANVAVAWAVGGRDLPDGAKPWLRNAVDHLSDAYATPVGHMRLARRASLLAPLAVVLILATWRVWRM